MDNIGYINGSNRLTFDWLAVCGWLGRRFRQGYNLRVERNQSYHLSTFLPTQNSALPNHHGSSPLRQAVAKLPPPPLPLRSPTGGRLSRPHRRGHRWMRGTFHEAKLVQQSLSDELSYKLEKNIQRHFPWRLCKSSLKTAKLYCVAFLLKEVWTWNFSTSMTAPRATLPPLERMQRPPEKTRWMSSNNP